jgi:hypothetical protein
MSALRRMAGMFVDPARRHAWSKRPQKECPGEFEKQGERDGRTIISPCALCGYALEEHMTAEERAYFGDRMKRLPEDMN